MAIYAIGDVQGCYGTLRVLLRAISFDPDHDEIWLAGDLVNRGPDSTSVLRWTKEHQSSVRAILGNHDLYLIARALGAVPRRRRDTLDELLAAPDSEALVDWLRHRPLLISQGPWLMVHAALHPDWSIDDAELAARELEALLRGDQARALLTESHAQALEPWSHDGPSRQRQLAALAVFTRLRCLSTDGALTFDYTGGLADLPEDRVPWWRVPHRRAKSLTVITGHWAALGYHREPGLLATDTGCAWGRHLTAVRLSDGAVTQVAADGSVSSPS
jgi:bis(5'-nucleosyl)-tetraphosphatase (symmetrical)